MKKQKTKLAVALLALACASVCLGVGAAKIVPSETSTVTVSAETRVRNMFKIGATKDSSRTAIYFYAENGDNADGLTSSWEEKYTFVEGSGDGVKYNGEALVGYEIKMPGNDVYFALGGKEAEAGDIVTLDGTFRNEGLDQNIVITSGALIYNGSAWENYEEKPEITYTVYTVNELTVHIHSRAGNENANNTTLWLWGTGDTSDAWAYYTCENGVGVQLNGEALSCNMQDFGNGLYLKDFTANEGDVVSIGGTFVSEERATKYVIPESHFQWNGSGWVVYTPPIEYTTHNITNLNVANESKAGGVYVANNVLSLTMEGGATTSNWPWFVYESGAGLKVNGEPAALTGGIPNAVQDTNGGLYFQFNGVNEGDKVSIGGTFVNAGLGLKYIIPEMEFIWKGTEWVSALEDAIEYTTYEIGTLNYFPVNYGEGKENFADFKRADGSEIIVKGEPGSETLWNAVFSYRAGSGVGVTLNGVANGIVKIPQMVFVELATMPAENDVLKIGGTFYNSTLAVEYVITESTFIYSGNTWVNQLDLEKTAAIDELSEYGDSFVEEDYYESEWKKIKELVKEGSGNIEKALTSDEVAQALADAKAAIDAVYTKAEADAIFNELKESSKTELESYKEETAYRANDWEAIQAIIADAKAAIDAAESVTAVQDAASAAKAEMDAIKTNEEWVAAEAVTANAIEELNAYVSAENYRDVEWAKIQTLLSDASTEINAAIFDDETIAQIVTNTKAAIDKVFTKPEAEEAEAVVAAAKAELATYKAQEDYYDVQWNEIQAILTDASNKLDKAFGNNDEIAQIVANAKAAIDEVETSAVVDAEALAAAKVAADEEALNFYATLDFSKYTQEDMVLINGYVEAVRYAIEQATTQEEIDAALAQFKADVNNVAGVVPPADSEEGDKDDKDDKDDEKSGGCGSLVAGGLSAGVVLAAAAVVAIRKKKED